MKARKTVSARTKHSAIDPTDANIKPAKALRQHRKTGNPQSTNGSCTKRARKTSKLASDTHGPEHYEYTPYGERQVFITIGSNDPYALSPFWLSDRKWIGGHQPYGRNPFGFQGLHHDEETGLVYNRARMLNPRLKRFNQRDPLGYPDGLNTYAAYHVMYGGVDPMGNETELPPISPTGARDDIYIYIEKREERF
jgi:RHS repeat-associated protein